MEEVQLLEDVICLVFLEFYWFPFSKKHALEPEKDAMGEEKLLDIVKKTWVKMCLDFSAVSLRLRSDAGHAAALELPLAEKPKALAKWKSQKTSKDLFNALTAQALIIKALS